MGEKQKLHQWNMQTNFIKCLFCSSRQLKVIPVNEKKTKSNLISLFHVHQQPTANHSLRVAYIVAERKMNRNGFPTFHSGRWKDDFAVFGTINHVHLCTCPTSLISQCQFVFHPLCHFAKEQSEGQLTQQLSHIHDVMFRLNAWIRDKHNIC